MGLFNETGKTPAKDFATRLGSKNRSEAEANGRDLVMMANKLGTDIEGVILHLVSSDKSGLDPVEAVFSHINIPLTAKDPRAKAMFAAVNRCVAAARAAAVVALLKSARARFTSVKAKATFWRALCA